MTATIRALHTFRGLFFRLFSRFPRRCGCTGGAR